MSVSGDINCVENASNGPGMETGPEGIPGYSEVASIYRSRAFKVFFAQDPNDELVVVKQLALNGSGGEEGVKIGSEEHILQERLASEALLLEELEHPQLPMILANNTDHFSPHFTMSPVTALRDLRLFKHVSDPLAVSRIIHSILEPLDYVHSGDIVHRDMKPANMFARWTGDTVLGDFGIAARRAEIATSSPGSRLYDASTGLTDTFGTVGTAEYASPEQAACERVDLTSDIYSLGISLFELLYGRRPYEPKDPNNRRDRIRAMNRRLYEDVDLTVPEGRDIPEPLIAVIERATQRKPADRYQSAEEMREDLARAIALVGESSWSRTA